MILKENVLLAGLTTLRIGGPALWLAECESEEDVRLAIKLAQHQGLPLAVLGEGSNVLARDESFPGVVLMPHILGITFEEMNGDETLLVAGAGVSWDALVRAASARGLWGVENLAGIPGTVGAAPVQNIGAYGSDLSGVFAWCDAIPRTGGKAIHFSNADAEFAYRDSIFKREGKWIITRVALRLRNSGVPNLAYKDLAALNERGALLTTPAHVGEAVRGIRARKFPDLATHGTAGSFFKNPAISASAYATLAGRYPGLPGFAYEGGMK